jgi:TPP-dependent pyruvate/acetoin dehydrogenase alpha subunit
VLAVRDAIAEAVQRARAGKGPSFVECLTHRLRGHYEGKKSEYERSEIDSKDVVRIFERKLIESGDILRDEATEIARLARERVEQAAKAALDAPWPQADQVTTQVLST